MSLLQKVYSVLLISASDNFFASLKPLLPGASYFPVHKVANLNAARRLLSEKSYDLVIINFPLPDANGVEFAIDISNSNATVVLLLVRNELYEEIHAETATYGIFSMPKPFTKQTFSLALNWLSIVRERLRANEQKEVSLEEKMNEIRLVNRAKWLLIRELKMDEPQAHRYIEKQAMDRCVTKREVAETLIATYS